jgi:hypothetical protein
MPKQPQFKPYKTLRAGASWCLDIPEYLSGTGKRQRLFFNTQKEAETASEQIKTRRANFGNTLAQLSPERITEAAEAYKLLDSMQSDVSLLSVVQAHLRQEKLRRKSVTFAQLFEQFINHLKEKDKTAEHLYKLGKTCERFPKLRNKLVSDITSEDLEPVLKKLKASTRDAETRHLRAVFNFGEPKFLLVNPADELKPFLSASTFSERSGNLTGTRSEKETNNGSLPGCATPLQAATTPNSKVWTTF